METYIKQYHEYMKQEYQRQIVRRKANIDFVNQRGFALLNAQQAIYAKVPGAVVYNVSSHWFESANGRIQDEYFFDAMYPFQDIQFTVSFEAGRYDRFKVIPFFKYNTLKCPLQKGPGSTYKYYVNANDLDELFKIFHMYWLI